MVETSLKTFEQEAWGARAAHWLDDAARATALAAPPLLAALGVGPKDALLDLCCGPGIVAGAAYAMGAKTTGVDYAPAMIAKARERLPEVAFRIGDAEALDVRANEFDAVACNFALQHLAHPEQAMREALRALKPGGKLAWTHWLAPEKNPIARACADALARHGDPALRDAALEANAYRLADPAAATSAMRRAGYREIETEILNLEIAAPRERVAATALAMLVRAPLALDRQPEAARAAIEAHLGEALTPREGADRMIRIAAPALLCVGVKLETAVARAPRFGIVKKLLSAAPKVEGAK